MTAGDLIPCGVCGKIFPVAATQLNRRTVHGKLCCSRTCRGGARGQKPLADRLDAGLNKSGGCWVWTRFRNSCGYGIIKVGKSKISTHRVAWEIANGKIPDGLNVCHKCDNPPCCNPDHLFLGAQRDNMQDCIRKGRFPSVVGTGNPRCILTEDAVREIRAKRTLGITEKMLAKEYGVSPGAINGIVSRKNWKHVT